MSSMRRGPAPRSATDVPHGDPPPSPCRRACRAAPGGTSCRFERRSSVSDTGATASMHPRRTPGRALVSSAAVRWTFRALAWKPAPPVILTALLRPGPSARGPDALPAPAPGRRRGPRSARVLRRADAGVHAGARHGEALHRDDAREDLVEPRVDVSADRLRELVPGAPSSRWTWSRRVGARRPRHRDETWVRTRGRPPAAAGAQPHSLCVARGRR
jgi:hypothetical protein